MSRWNEIASKPMCVAVKCPCLDHVRAGFVPWPCGYCAWSDRGTRRPPRTSFCSRCGSSSSWLWFLLHLTGDGGKRTVCCFNYLGGIMQCFPYQNNMTSMKKKCVYLIYQLSLGVYLVWLCKKSQSSSLIFYFLLFNFSLLSSSRPPPLSLCQLCYVPPALPFSQTSHHLSPPHSKHY